MEIVGEYSDEGHSGKNIKRRQEFMRMLNDSEDGGCTQLFTAYAGLWCEPNLCGRWNRQFKRSR